MKQQAASGWEAEISKCAKCGKCRSICPVFLETGKEYMVARGRISLAEALRDGEIFHTELLRDYLLSCKKCLRCSSICPSGVDYDVIIQGMIDDLSKTSAYGSYRASSSGFFCRARWLFDILFKDGYYLSTPCPSEASWHDEAPAVYAHGGTMGSNVG